MTFVFKPSENVKKKMIEYYEDAKKPKAPPYAMFQAMEADTTITMYESGKVMFQGISADVDFDIWATMEKRFNNRDIRKELDGKDKKKDDKKDKDTTKNEYLKHISTLGSDEVGTGDYFGPIVVTAAYVSKEDIEFVKELGVGDSKRLTDEKIIDIAPKLIDKIPHYTLSLSNTDYNKNSSDNNMNKMKAILHNKALINIIEKYELKPEKIVVDQFAYSTKYYEYLEGVPKVLRNIFFLTKAEDQVYSVAVASIIARYTFLVKMKEISTLLGKTVPLGAGSIVDEYAKEMVQKHGVDILNTVTKRNFKNTEKILGN